MNEEKSKQFNHLKIHTQYSICEGALKTTDLARYCKSNQVKAVGLCDSNNLCGALEFSELLAKSKTQPIIGTQINIKYKGNIGKIPLFAKNLDGYKNLIKLSSKSFLDVKDIEDPHCTIEDIEKNFKGIILLTGSFDSLIGKLFFKNLTEEVMILLKRFKKVFKEDIYIEIQRHNDEGEKLFEKFLINTSKNLTLPIIATQEVYYLDKDMFEAHDAYLCIGEKTYVNVKERRKYTDQHYLKSSEEMYELFKDLPDALENNENFPFRVSYRPKNSLPVLPNIQTSKTENIDTLLVKESTEGLKEKLREYVVPFYNKDDLEKIIKDYNERLNHEIKIIPLKFFSISTMVQ